MTQTVPTFRASPGESLFYKISICRSSNKQTYAGDISRRTTSCLTIFCHCLGNFCLPPFSLLPEPREGGKIIAQGKTDKAVALGYDYIDPPKF